MPNKSSDSGNTREMVFSIIFFGLPQIICDVLCDLVSFVQYKKHENTLGGKFLLLNTPAWMFFTFFKLYKWYQIAQRKGKSGRQKQPVKMFYKKVELFLKNSTCSQKNVCVGVSFWWSCRLEGLQLHTKETPTQVFSS